MMKLLSIFLLGLTFKLMAQEIIISDYHVVSIGNNNNNFNERTSIYVNNSSGSFINVFSKKQSSPNIIFDKLIALIDSERLLSKSKSEYSLSFIANCEFNITGEMDISPKDGNCNLVSAKLNIKFINPKIIYTSGQESVVGTKMMEGKKILYSQQYDPATYPKICSGLNFYNYEILKNPGETLKPNQDPSVTFLALGYCSASINNYGDLSRLFRMSEVNKYSNTTAQMGLICSEVGTKSEFPITFNNGQQIIKCKLPYAEVEISI